MGANIKAHYNPLSKRSEFLTGVTKRKEKARRSLAPRFPSEWANSREAFRKAVWHFEYGQNSASPAKNLTGVPSKIMPGSPSFKSQERFNTQASPEVIRSCPNPAFITPKTFEISTIPRDVLTIFNGFDKLDGENWNTWKGHMQDNLEMCNLWDMVTGKEEKPEDVYSDYSDTWKRRDLTARVLIKNSLGAKDYQQVRHAKTAADIWKTLVGLHQPTDAQGKVDLVWKFWSKRCAEGASIHEHNGEIPALHAELAELGV